MTVTNKLKNIFRLLIICSLFFCTTLFEGCNPKPEDSGAPKDLTGQGPKIKVLLKNTGNFKLNCNGSFQICEKQSGRIQMYVKRSIPVDVSFHEGKVTINSIKFNGPVELYSTEDVFSIDGSQYRGNLTISANLSSREILAITELPHELYLAGVIASEMPARWDKEALKAQAIAARSYALNNMQRRFGNDWHVKCTQASQVYAGISAESKKIWDVLSETQGEVIVSGDSVLPAYFSSTCGGATFNATDVFGSADDAIVGVKCDHCRKSAKSEYLNWPEFKIEKKEAYKLMVQNYPKIAGIEELQDVKPVKTSKNGENEKILSVKLIGKNGKTEILRGEDFRLTIDPTGFKLKSTVCKIKTDDKNITIYDGKGFGHNVGMCQYGAKAMADEGSKYRDIITYYYPNSNIKKVY